MNDNNCLGMYYCIINVPGTKSIIAKDFFNCILVFMFILFLVCRCRCRVRVVVNFLFL